MHLLSLLSQFILAVSLLATIATVLWLAYAAVS